MQPAFAFFAGFGAWNWFILAVAAVHPRDLAARACTFFGSVSPPSSSARWRLLTGVGWPWQIIAFGLISRRSPCSGCASYVRPDVAMSDLPDLNVRGQQYVGRSLVVEQAIQNGRGKVRVGDTLWQAEGPDAARRRPGEVTGRPEEPCWWWSVLRPDGSPARFAWAVAIVSLALPWLGIGLCLAGLLALSRGEPTGWWLLLAGARPLIADIADRFRLGAPGRRLRAISPTSTNAPASWSVVSSSSPRPSKAAAARCGSATRSGRSRAPTFPAAPR